MLITEDLIAAAMAANPTMSRASILGALNPTVDAGAVVVITVDTGHFTFVGLGATREQAVQGLIERWERHCKVNPDADMLYMVQLIDEGSFEQVELKSGTAVIYGID